VAEHMPAGACPVAGRGGIADQQVEIHGQQRQQQGPGAGAQLTFTLRCEAVMSTKPLAHHNRRRGAPGAG